ncbi:MAG: hypothetical protein NWQ54_14150, partial [Paraglaciecola sp.]|nr:hypothetical protein [Paraglaciecola sp.]
FETESVNETAAARAVPTQMMPVADTALVTPPIETNKSVSSAVKEQIKPVAMGAVTAQCKHCGDCSALSPQSGRYGYYVQCGSCGGNTPLKRPCPACNSQNTKVSRARSVYRLICADCSTPTKFILKSN